MCIFVTWTQKCFFCCALLAETGTKGRSIGSTSWWGEARFRETREMRAIVRAIFGKHSMPRYAQCVWGARWLEVKTGMKQMTRIQPEKFSVKTLRELQTLPRGFRKVRSSDMGLENELTEQWSSRAWKQFEWRQNNLQWRHHGSPSSSASPTEVGIPWGLHGFTHRA